MDNSVCLQRPGDFDSKFYSFPTNCFASFTAPTASSDVPSALIFSAQSFVIGAPPTMHLDARAQTFLIQLFDYFALTDHRGGEQRAHADDLRIDLQCLADDLFSRLVHAQVGRLQSQRR